MPLFNPDSAVLYCSNVDRAKRWWMKSFDCEEVRIPADWDNSLPSDVALTLPIERTTPTARGASHFVRLTART